MLRVLLFVFVLALYIYVFIDLATAPSDEVRVLPRPVWLLVVLVVPVLGCVAWLTLGRPVSSRGEGGGSGGGLRERFPFPGSGGPSGYAAGPIAPDDDPDFLRDLDDKRRRSEDNGST